MIQVRTSSNDITVITFNAQSLDASNVKQFKDAIQPLLDHHIIIMLDMHNLNFIDSSGLGALLSCLRKMKDQNKVFKFYGLTEPVRALFELVRMQRIFSIHNDLAEAINSL